MDFIRCRYGRLYWYLVCIYFYVCTVEAAFQEADGGDADDQVQPPNENQVQLPEPAGGVNAAFNEVQLRPLARGRMQAAADGMRASPGVPRALIDQRQVAGIMNAALRLFRHLVSSVGLLLGVSGRQVARLFRQLLHSVPRQILLLAGLAVCLPAVLLFLQDMGPMWESATLVWAAVLTLWGALLVAFPEGEVGVLPVPPAEGDRREFRRWRRWHSRREGR